MPGIARFRLPTVNIFDRDRNGEQHQLESQLRRTDTQAADLAPGIERELRKAMLDLQSTRAAAQGH